MGYLYSIVLFIFVIVCLLLLGIILLQTSQTGGMGSIGGGNSYLEGALGGQGADKLLLRTTTIFAVIFMSLAIVLNVINNPTEQYQSEFEYEEGLSNANDSEQESSSGDDESGASGNEESEPKIKLKKTKEPPKTTE